MTRELEIVVAHYNEDLSWLLPWSQHVTVYHKGQKGSLDLRQSFNRWIDLPNVGREGHTYLHHIVTRYQTLANTTIFVQGKIDDHPHLPIDEYIDRAKRDGFSHTHSIKIRNWEGRIKHHLKWLDDLNQGRMKPAIGSFGDFWDGLFGLPCEDIQECKSISSQNYRCLRRDFSSGQILKWHRVATSNHDENPYRGIGCCRPDALEFFWAGCFGVSKVRIHQHEIKFYQKIIPYLDSHSNPEEGHYLERLWLTIFRSRRNDHFKMMGSFNKETYILKQIQQKLSLLQDRSAIKNCHPDSNPTCILTIIDDQASKLIKSYQTKDTVPGCESEKP